MDREFKWLEKRVQESSGPIVLCHNDPHGSNMRVGWYLNTLTPTHGAILRKLDKILIYAIRLNCFGT